MRLSIFFVVFALHIKRERPNFVISKPITSQKNIPFETFAFSQNAIPSIEIF